MGLPSTLAGTAGAKLWMGDKAALRVSVTLYSPPRNLGSFFQSPWDLGAIPTVCSSLS